MDQLVLPPILDACCGSRMMWTSTPDGMVWLPVTQSCRDNEEDAREELRELNAANRGSRLRLRKYVRQPA